MSDDIRSDGDTTQGKDLIERAIDSAALEIKHNRSNRIGALLDKATNVLSDVLDTVDPSHERMRMQAAELTISLYTANETAQRADRQLDIQAKRLQVEAKKVGVNTLLLQQNNVYSSSQAPAPQKTLVKTEDGSIVDVDLLARKKAQQMLLDAQIAEAVSDTEGLDVLSILEENDED